MKRTGRKLGTVLLMFSMLGCSTFPAYAKYYSSTGVHAVSGVNGDSTGSTGSSTSGSNYDLTDNVIEFDEVPELVEKYGPLARSQQASLNTTSQAYQDVDSAYKDSYEDVQSSYDELIDELKEQRDSTTDKDTRKQLNQQITELNKEKKSALKEIQDTGNNLKNSQEIRDRAVASAYYSAKVSVANAYQKLIFSYKSMELSMNLAEKSVALYQKNLEKAETQQQSGSGTSASVEAAKLSLESAQNSLKSLQDSAAALKRTIGVGLGWTTETAQNITFGELPQYDSNFLSGRDLETDIQSVLQRNSQMGEANRIQDKDPTTWDNREITLNATEQEIRIAMNALYKDVQNQKTALEAAETQSAVATKSREKAERMDAAGLLSRSDYLQQELTAIQQENAAESERLTYNQTVYEYLQAVEKGVLTLES